jgi:hypothetical protein
MTAVEYPTITGTSARRFFDSCDQARLARNPPDPAELEIEWITTGDSTGRPTRFDTRPLYEIARKAMRDIERGMFDTGSKDRFEAHIAMDFHALLDGVAGEAMNHRGFWRFLAIGPLASCTVCRQDGKNLPTAFGLPPSTGRRRSSEPFALVRCLPWRLWMRAEIGGPEYVGVIGSDLWWSHLFRVQIGRSRPTARSFLDQAGGLPVADQRRFAPLVTAARGRLSFDALDDDEVDHRVNTEKLRAAGRSPVAVEETSDPALADEAEAVVPEEDISAW